MSLHLIPVKASLVTGSSHSSISCLQY